MRTALRGKARLGRLSGRPLSRRSGLVGLEHEFVLRREEDQVDFRELIHRLAIPGRRIDPGDQHAYRTRSGLMVTCDGPEAEIATPPVEIRPGFAGELETWAGSGAQLLLDMLPDDLSVEGCSTHLSVSIDDDVNDAVCRLFAHTFSPALMLLMDDRDSPGLLIRPRHGRVELGAEYVHGGPLRAAAMLAVGGVRACAQFYRSRRSRLRLPPRLQLTVEPALERFGWYVDRRAFGVDLYHRGRQSRLHTANGQDMSAQEHLEAAWTAAVAQLRDDVDPEELAAGSRFVVGLDPLPIDTGPSHRPVPISRRLVSAHGVGLEPISRPGFSAEVIVATWDLTLFELAGQRRAYLAVPRGYLAPFLPAMRSGMLDRSIERYLRKPARGRRVDSYEQAVAGPALYDEIGLAPALVAPEREWDGVPRARTRPASEETATLPGRARRADSGAVSRTLEDQGRAGKGDRPPFTQPPPVEPPPPPGGRPWLPWTIGIAIALVALVIAIMALSGGDSSTDGTASPTTDGPAAAVTTSSAAPSPTTPGATPQTSQPPQPTGPSEATTSSTRTIPTTNPTVQPTDTDIGNSTLLFPWTALLTKTATLDVPETPFPPLPVGTMFDIQLNIEGGCDNTTGVCSEMPTGPYFRVLDPIAPPEPIELQPWITDGASRTVTIIGYYVSSSVGVTTCVYQWTEEWDVTVTDAALIDGVWYATAFEGTMILTEEYNKALSTGDLDRYCGEYKGSDEWAVSAERGIASLPTGNA